MFSDGLKGLFELLHVEGDPVQVSADFLKQLFSTIEENADAEFEVDLENQQIKILDSGSAIKFDINPYKKECLLKGYDDIDYLLSLKSRIQAFEKQD